MMAGIPGQMSGAQRSVFIENDRLVTPNNKLQHTFLIFKENQGFEAKYDKSTGGDTNPQ